MNKYEIIGIVGEGAYGIVYKAKNKDSGEYGKYNNTFQFVKLKSITKLKIDLMDKWYYIMTWIKYFRYSSIQDQSKIKLTFHIIFNMVL